MRRIQLRRTTMGALSRGSDKHGMILRLAQFPCRSRLENSGSSKRVESVRSVHWRANSAGVIHCNAGYGARLVIVLVPDLILRLASSRDKNQWALRHSSRKRPLKDSFFALSVGLPGREKSVSTPFSDVRPCADVLQSILTFLAIRHFAVDELLVNALSR